ncbi:MAG TPA: ABC transporter substrate-binding protein [Candidatus Binataceae bacterium]|nr:ABC transporter substrate-binding protein [Candidatus Binataceae bacterium]
MTRDLTLGLSLSLSGKYAAMGKQAAAAIALLVADLNAAGGITLEGVTRRVAHECFDDQSRVDRTREIYRELCFTHRRDLVFGPYSSALARAAAPLAEEAGMLFVNHGGADDALHDRGYRMIVSVLSPASEYLVGFARLLATLKFWRKRLAIAAANTPFATTVAAGLERATQARRIWLHGVRLKMKYTGTFDHDRTPDLLMRALRRNRINAFVSVGGYEHDLAMMRVAAAEHLNIPVLGCVAAGVDRFGFDLGAAAEGIVGPSQWEPELELRPETGPSPAEFARRMRATAGACDYPAAQIYAAGLLTVAAIRAADSPAPAHLRAAFADLRTTTLFGAFAINRVTGQQLEHQMLLVQWHEGRKHIIGPDEQSADGDLELPSGWRLLLGSAGRLRINRRSKSAPAEEKP